MSEDGDNEKNFSTEDEPDESKFTLLPAAKTRRKRLSDLRHPRQKFCLRWEKDFPWLKADNLDESVGICTVCNKHLVCKKSHLERHQKSYKHQRLQGFETLDTTEGDNTQPAAPEFLECGKREIENDEEEFGNAIEVDPEYNVEFEELNPLKRLKRDNAKISAGKNSASAKRSQHPNAKLVSSTPSSNSKSSVQRSGTNKLDRFKLLKRIDRDRTALNEYYYARLKQISPTPQHLTSLPTAQRDTFDLFFESVSASVKTLPPKLAAEVKSRVSQIIAEYELRAICEREAQESVSSVISIAAKSETVAEASTTHDMVASTSSPTHMTSVTEVASIESTAVTTGDGLPHIVYTFQSKLRN